MNRLSHSTSPYLLQHAHNPVDWFEWGEEALSRARSENKPIFLSIGYAACHWCHVMAHESFEDAAVAAFMNEHFVNIKVDREQRPDLDSIYMTATTSLTGSGGWPMSVFLTPALKPFYAGTYFPPVPRFNMPSFRDLLTSIARAWQEERDEVERIGAQVNEHLQRQSTWQVGSVSFTSGLLNDAVKHLHETYDYGFGGWGQAPKFPQAMTIEFLLRRSLASRHEGYPDETALKPALHALRAMARGGMYDVVGGGFSRYSTDNLWRVPHFEKMLYDNAQLARTYLHAWQISGDPFFRRVVEETLSFIMREMTGPDGGFYSSLDADSEGQEGKFYVWTQAELENILGDDFEFFQTAYGITPAGNWEDHTVLQRSLDDATLTARFKLSPAALAEKLSSCHARLLQARSARIRPATDDKVLACWNGLMLSAFAEAARVFQNSNNDFSRLPNIDAASVQSTASSQDLASTYLSAATRSADFLLTALRPEGHLRRAWRAGGTSPEVFLEDYAALIEGLLELYQTDFDPRWFAAARELADEMIERFVDPAGGFFDTPSGSDVLLLRPKDLQDNATPSGNALAVDALLHLAAFTGDDDTRIRAEQSFAPVVEVALRYPSSFARWLSAADFALTPARQLAIVGDPSNPATQALLATSRSAYRPHMVVAASAYPPASAAPALLADRPLLNGQPAAYVCEGFTCKMPVTTPQQLREQL